jgi:neuromedin U receptor 1
MKVLISFAFITLSVLFRFIYASQESPIELTDPITLNFTVNLSRQEFLEQNLGPRKRPTSLISIMSSIYILILVCGLFGNISTCCVIILNSCMHTTTNYYLFSLAVSDVLSLLIGLPVELTELFNGTYPWIFGKWFCKIRIFLFETTTIASVLTILMFTCERWLHICKAIYAKKFSSGFSRALKIILFIWAVSGFLALPFAFTSGKFNLKL